MGLERSDCGACIMMKMAVRLLLLLVASLVVGVMSKRQWVITRDDGRALEDVAINSLDDFLEFAQLDEDGYADQLTAEVRMCHLVENHSPLEARHLYHKGPIQTSRGEWML